MPPAVIALAPAVIAAVGSVAKAKIDQNTAKKAAEAQAAQAQSTTAASTAAGGGGGGPTWLPGAIQAGGTALSAYLTARAQNNATKASAGGNEASLAYTKEQDALARQDQQKREALWQQQYNAWNQMRNQALSRWGFQGSMPNVSGYEMAAPQGASAMGGGAPMQAGAAQPVSQSPYTPDRAALGDLMARRGELGNWNDWSQLGLGTRTA